MNRLEYDVKLLNISRFNFDNDSGENVKMCKIFFLMGDDIDSENQKGREVNSAILPYEKFDELKKLDLPYDCKVIYESAGLKRRPKFIEIII